MEACISINRDVHGYLRMVNGEWLVVWNTLAQRAAYHRQGVERSGTPIQAQPHNHHPSPGRRDIQPKGRHIIGRARSEAEPLYNAIHNHPPSPARVDITPAACQTPCPDPNAFSTSSHFVATRTSPPLMGVLLYKYMPHNQHIWKSVFRKIGMCNGP